MQGFDGTWIHTDTEYDHLGRVARRSEPYYAGAVTQYWTRYEYDLLGRVTRTTLPDYDAGATNSLITVRYDGLATTTTNGKGQRQVQTRNALDEVIRTADHTGTTVTHTYNAWGQVTGTRTSGTGVDAVTVTMAYDGRGRRTTLTDPDRGTWTYAWNGFDELVTQTDAVGNVQALSYDGLGRVSARLDYRARQTAPVANTQWEYDPANGLGQLGEVREMPFSGHRRTHRWVDGVQVNNTSRKTYREITSRDARGTVTGEKLGGGACQCRCKTPHLCRSKIPQFVDGGRSLRLVELHSTEDAVRLVSTDGGYRGDYLGEIIHASRTSCTRRQYQRHCPTDGAGPEDGPASPGCEDPSAGVRTENAARLVTEPVYCVSANPA